MEFDFIGISKEKLTWQEAIYLASKLLIDKKIITDYYIDSMIANVVENGPYIVIMLHLAIPHSRCEDGALKNGISLLKLAHETIFPDDKEVGIIIVISTVDNQEHMKTLSALCDLLMDEELVNKVLQTNDEKKIKKILCQK